jgi:predicted nucleotidyltransferase
VTPEDLRARLRDVLDPRELHLLVLLGSRARADHRPDSDWDVGYRAGPGFDVGGLVADLTRLLGTDAVDAVDLAAASAVLRFRSARDGRVLYERTDGEFERFQQEAVRFWCDAGPVVRRAQDDLLAAL